MTFPTGSPGGYQGQPQQGPGYGQPQQGPGFAPSAPARAGGGVSLGLEEIIALAVGLLGLISLFIGFVPVNSGVSFYDGGAGWLPAGLATAGLLALLVVLPGNKDVKWGGLVVIVHVGVVLPVLFSLFIPSGDLAAGGVILLIFAILQLLGSIALYLLESGLIKMPAKPAYPTYGAPGYGQPGSYGPPPQGPGGYGPPPGQSPQTGPQTAQGPQATQVFGAAPQQPYGQPGQPGPQQGPGTPPSGFDGGSSPQ